MTKIRSKESIDYLFEKGDFLADQNHPNQSPGISVPSNSPNSSTNSSTTISGFLIDEEIVLKESSNQSEDISAPIESSSRASFSCNGTSELPLHIQDVRERVKRELGKILTVYRGGPHMVAIIIMTGTKYACNERNDLDQICLQSRLERGLNLDDCKHIWSLLKEIANIYSPIPI